MISPQELDFLRDYGAHADVCTLNGIAVQRLVEHIDHLSGRVERQAGTIEYLDREVSRLSCDLRDQGNELAQAREEAEDLRDRIDELQVEAGGADEDLDEDLGEEPGAGDEEGPGPAAAPPVLICLNVGVSLPAHAPGVTVQSCPPPPAEVFDSLFGALRPG